MSQYKIDAHRGVNCFFEYRDKCLILRHDDKEITLNDAEISLLLQAISLMLISENTSDIEDWRKSTLATSYTLAFNETRRICETKEHDHYSATLGLLIENSQTAYNLHKSRRKGNS